MQLSFRLILLVTIGAILASCSSSPESVALSVAKTVVKERLISPATANFVNAEILEKKVVQGNTYFLIRFDVDAQNSYGALIRNIFFVVGYINPKEPETLRYNEYTSILQAHNPPEDWEILAMKNQMNVNWGRK